jgi:hypothetical protein
MALILLRSHVIFKVAGAKEGSEMARSSSPHLIPPVFGVDSSIVPHCREGTTVAGPRIASSTGGAQCRPAGPWPRIFFEEWCGIGIFQLLYLITF